MSNVKHDIARPTWRIGATGWRVVAHVSRMTTWGLGIGVRVQNLTGRCDECKVFVHLLSFVVGFGVEITGDELWRRTHGDAEATP